MTYLRRRTIASAFLVAGLSACLSRDVATVQPLLRHSVVAAQEDTVIRKIDLLFAVDDSGSMGDKQEFLRQAVPVLLKRLVQPNCVNEAGSPVPRDASGGCVGGAPEFDAITDIHIGVVSSSLGTAGDVCQSWGRDANNNPVRAADAPRVNRHAQLFAPAGTGAPVTESAKFLSWLPDVPREFDPSPAAAPYKTVDALNTAFQKFFDPSIGVGQSGCGVEAQLESVYRFLVQPDPTGDTDVPGAQRDAIASQILAQRKAFLRPDSLVAVVMLTDENDASVDPAVFAGQGSRFSSFSFGAVGDPAKPGYLAGSDKVRRAPYSGSKEDRGATFPRPLASCAALKNPTREQLQDCSSCADARVSGRPECASPYLEVENDSFNARYVRMKKRYGLDPLYPLSRYVRGFSEPLVPNRGAEHDGSGNYQEGAKNCRNPLFAAELPESMDQETCALRPGVRSADMVYFAVIGGVPQDLLRDAWGPKKQLSETDWVRILGTNPERFDFDGIDPRMYEMGTPRTAEALEAEQVRANPAGIAEVRAAQLAAGKTEADADFVLNDRNANVAGKETGFGADLNYACTFPLSTPRTVTQDDIDGVGDCNRFYPNEACTPSSGSVASERKQTRAKAYPTTRELSVVRSLGGRGIAASLCPLRIAPRPGMSAEADPDYGYNPAVASIVERLKERLNGRCLSQPLKPLSAEGEPVRVDCAFYELEADSDASQDGDCAGKPGRSVADANGVSQFRRQLESQGEGDLAQRQICLLKELPVRSGETCYAASEPGWCYVQKNGAQRPAGVCEQAIIFQKSTVLKGSPIRYVCLSL